MKLMLVLIYGFLFSVAFFAAALVWHWQMAGVYFMSPGKGLISDFLPPFVDRTASDSYYIHSQRVVYFLWMVHIGIAVVVPAVCAWLIGRFHDRALQKSWSEMATQP